MLEPRSGIITVHGARPSMLIPPPAWDALLDAGLSVAAVDSRTVELGPAADGSGPLLLEVKSYSKPLNPESVRRLLREQAAKHPLLLVVPSASAAVRAEVRRAQWSLIALNSETASGPDGFIDTGRSVIPLLVDDDHRPVPPPRRRGPAAFGAATVIRQLLQTPAPTQVEMARRAGVSQARVSQVFADLTGHGLLRRAAHGGRWQIVDWDELLDHWLALYPGPQGIATYWYGLDPVVEQANRVVDFLSGPPRGRATQEPSERSGRVSAWRPPVVSGDVAVDRLVPWHRPMRAVIYASEGRDLTVVGLTPSGHAEATCEVIVPRDPGVWNAPPQASAGGRSAWVDESRRTSLADAVQILWDLMRLPGADRDQAAERYRLFLRNAYEHAQASSTAR